MPLSLRLLTSRPAEVEAALRAAGVEQALISRTMALAGGRRDLLAELGVIEEARRIARAQARKPVGIKAPHWPKASGDPGLAAHNASVAEVHQRIRPLEEELSDLLSGFPTINLP